VTPLRLARLAGDRPALELAVGTGRIALPLVRAGTSVDGIELSQDMVDRMREKANGDRVEVTIGDMSEAVTGRIYGLVYLVYNTIGNLITQDEQVRCFENAAHHLADDGVFVTRVPGPGRPGVAWASVDRRRATRRGRDRTRRRSVQPVDAHPRHEPRPPGA
jgi:SAM-dependent methyltransferase